MRPFISVIFPHFRLGEPPADSFEYFFKEGGGLGLLDIRLPDYLGKVSFGIKSGVLPPGDDVIEFVC